MLNIDSTAQMLVLCFNSQLYNQSECYDMVEYVRSPEVDRAAPPLLTWEYLQ